MGCIRTFLTQNTAVSAKTAKGADLGRADPVPGARCFRYILLMFAVAYKGAALSPLMDKVHRQ